jgi:bacteriorhodopsin
MSSVVNNSTETVPDNYLSDTPITENGKGQSMMIFAASLIVTFSLGEILVCIGKFVGLLVIIVAALAVLITLTTVRLWLYSGISFMGLSGVLFVLFLVVQAVAKTRGKEASQVISKIRNIYYFACC